VSVDESVSIVLEAFRAVEHRDEQRLRELCHPEVTFHWPPSLPFGASHAGIGDSWSEVWDRLQPTDAQRRMDPRVVAATEPHEHFDAVAVQRFLALSGVNSDHAEGGGGAGQ
jgi:ketosteroid isomerase-like protein